MRKIVISSEISSVSAAIRNAGLTSSERAEALAAYTLAEVISSAIAALFVRAAPAGAVAKSGHGASRPALKV